MKNPTGWLLPTLLLMLFAVLPSTGRAQASPIDCSEGCYIITCNTQLCTLWRCDASGCEYVTGWERRVVEGPLAAGRAAKPAASGPEIAYATVCAPGRRCDLYELSTTEALRLGSFDNVADLVEYRESMRRGAVRQE